MITVNELTKSFGTVNALDNVTTQINESSIYGLVGSNGSGKSTLLRLISGVYKQESGELLIDGESPFENPLVKEKILLVSDDPYFLPNSSMDEMADFYKNLYPDFDNELYSFLCQNFPIDAKAKINTFSKGMKRQVSLILALSSKPQILLLDEAFDGLDPVIRQVVRKLLVDAVAGRGVTIIIASHNLRELEDLCDHLGLLHKGKIVFQREIDESKLGVTKVQVAFDGIPDDDIFDSLEVLSMQSTGSVRNIIVKGNSREIQEYLSSYNPLFIESLPLTLEEVFIYEMEAVNYDYSSIIF